MTQAPPRIKLDKEGFESSGYERLVGNKGWKKIHPTIRKRFSEKLHQLVTYKGVMNEVHLSFAGKVFAQLCRIIGTPLALYEGKNVPMEVKVYPNEKLKGMTWDRYYRYQDKPSNRVTSTKCILPEGGLVEMVGCGFGMKLDVYEKNGAIIFESEEFFWKLGNKEMRIPNWMTPGKTIVRQRAINNEEFEFRLDVRHPILGQVYRQIGVFKADENKFETGEGL